MLCFLVGHSNGNNVIKTVDFFHLDKLNGGFLYVDTKFNEESL